jgi:subtilisin-like proprotein convertase family protein
MRLVERKISKLLMVLILSSLLILSSVTIVPLSKGQVTKVYNSTDVPKHITDLVTIESVINVPDKGTIQDINVEITIEHTWDSDLDVDLVSPTDTVITLFLDVGGSGDNFIDTILDDEATTLITDGIAPFTGSYKPEDSLSDLDGEEMQGTWILRVYDDASPDEGDLVSWSITIVYPSPPIFSQWWFWLIIVAIIVVVVVVIVIVVRRRKPKPSMITPPPPPPPPTYT